MLDWKQFFRSLSNQETKKILSSFNQDRQFGQGLHCGKHVPDWVLNPRSWGHISWCLLFQCDYNLAVHFILLSNESCINCGCNYFQMVFWKLERVWKQHVAFILTHVFLKKIIFFHLENSKESFYYIFLLSLTKEYVSVKVAMTFVYRMGL